jgi:hypothetical protein
MNSENQRRNPMEPQENIKRLDNLTKQRMLEHVMDFVETSDLPSTVSSMLEIGEQIAELNTLVAGDETLSPGDIHSVFYTLKRFTDFYTSLYWLAYRNG